MISTLYGGDRCINHLQHLFSTLCMGYQIYIPSPDSVNYVSTIYSNCLLPYIMGSTIYTTSHCFLPMLFLPIQNNSRCWAIKRLTWSMATYYSGTGSTGSSKLAAGDRRCIWEYRVSPYRGRGFHINHSTGAQSSNERIKYSKLAVKSIKYIKVK